MRPPHSRILRFLVPFKIRTKLIIAFFAIIFPFIAIVGTIAIYNANTIRNASLKAEAISEKLHLVLSLQLAIDKSLMPGNNYIITGDKKYIYDFKTASKVVEDSIKNVDETLLILKGMETPEGKEEMEMHKSVKTAWQNIKENSQKIFEIRNPVGNKEAIKLMEEMYYKWAYPAIKMLDKHHEIDRKEHAEAIEKLQKAWMMAWGIMIGGSVFLITFGVFFALFYSRIFTRPIQAIHNGANTIAGGNFKTRVDIKTGDEFEQLSNAMNDMAIQLDSLYSNLEQNVEERTRELRESEEKYRIMIEISNDWIWTLTPDGRLTFINKQAEDGSSHAHEEWLGKTFEPLILEDDLPMVVDIHNKVVRGEKAHYEVRVKRKDGGVIILSVNASPIFKDGKVTGTISFGRDITERKKAEERIKEQLDYLERFQKVAVKREFRIKELTDEVERLKEKIEEMGKK